jgi:hypothetical protein
MLSLPSKPLDLRAAFLVFMQFEESLMFRFSRRHLVAVLALMAVVTSDAAAQRRPNLRRPGGRPGVGKADVEVSGNGQHFMNEVEGTIWEFKMIPKSSTSAKTKKEQEEVQEEATEGNAAPEQPGPKGPLADRLRGGKGSQPDDGSRGIVTVDEDGTMRGKLRINGNGVYDGSFRRQTAEQEHRVGDFSAEEKEDNAEYEIRFDDFKLKGRAVWTDKSRQEGGVYVGTYTDEHKKRWRFELRRGED